MLQGPKATVRRARALRRDMSSPEVMLWRALRTRPNGLKFRRQHPAGPYVADFYCHGAGLIVEIDGETRSLGDRPQRDAERDRRFADRRFAVLRIPARAVLKDVDAVADGVVARALAGIPLHQPAAGPPPLPGEE